MGITPAELASELIAGVAPEWGRITKGDINLRRELLEALCTETGGNGVMTCKLGIPGLYLFTCAREGDQVAYDILLRMGAQLEFDRPKSPGGVDANAARDFVVHLLSTVLQIEFPELSPGANDATASGASSVDMIRKALEDTWLGCIDYRAPVGSAPTPRSMERARRRFREKSKYRELFWPDIDAPEESCHT